MPRRLPPDQIDDGLASRAASFLRLAGRWLLSGLGTLAIGTVLVLALGYWMVGGGAREEQRATGESFGESATQADCVAESLRRVDQRTLRWLGAFTEPAFLSGCLAVAQPTPDICTNAREPESGEDSRVVTEAFCEPYEVDYETCVPVYISMMRHCQNR